MFPVQVIQLDLDEIPPRLAAVVHGQQVVEDLLIAVERPPEVADAPGLALAQQKVEHAAVDKTFVERLDALVAAHIQRALVQQQACQHLGIQEDTLTAHRNLFQRLRPCRVTAELFYQSLPVIGTDVLQIVLILAAQLNPQRIFRIVFHGRHVTGHD